jgi:hypothetical protein
MPGTIKRLAGPLALTNTLTTNVYNNASALVYDAITHIHIANKTSLAVSFTLYLGATGANAAGTELWLGHSIAPNSEFDWYSPGLKLTSTDFLVGGASAATSLTIVIMGESYVV